MLSTVVTGVLRVKIRFTNDTTDPARLHIQHA